MKSIKVWQINIIRLVTVALGMGAAVLGIRQGDMGDTLVKAITVCLECIGIG